MKTRSTLAVVAVSVVAGLGASATAQTYTLDWEVDGAEHVTVTPGTSVTVVGRASWAPAGIGLAGTMFNVSLTGADATDGLNYSEAAGWGRHPSLRMLPQALTDGAIAGGRRITGPAGVAIDAAQMPQMFNPLFNLSNPIEVFRFQLTAGDAGRDIDVGSLVTSARVYTTPQGQFTLYQPTVDGARISVVPTPGAVALLGLGGLAAVRRRRA